MRKIIVLITLIALFGCKSKSDKDKQKQNTDTVNVAKTDKIVVEKSDSIAVKKVSQGDTIRDIEKTQMNGDFLQKAVVNLSESSLIVYQNIRADYRIFGYQKPDTNSRKMVFFSVFTSDVEDNPYKCPYGSYYSSSAMQNTDIKFVKKDGAFVKANLINEKDSVLTAIYIHKDWVQFETKN